MERRKFWHCGPKSKFLQATFEPYVEHVGDKAKRFLTGGSNNS